VVELQQLELTVLEEEEEVLVQQELLVPLEVLVLLLFVIQHQQLVPKKLHLLLHKTLLSVEKLG
jgi:hypothetical protein